MTVTAAALIVRGVNWRRPWGLNSKLTATLRGPAAKSPWLLEVSSYHDKHLGHQLAYNYYVIKIQCVNVSLTTTTNNPPFTITIHLAAFKTTTSGLLVNYKIKPPSIVFNLIGDCDMPAESLQVAQDRE
ncbi:hypothetical protein F4678DRAFT_181 [Xylaria arbuscula]|nr:hypothetical protein F4678DRAFT_181 [Xylaria arbuscula]